ncbi:MAG: hypothetical protein U0003_04850 [Vampirovibrionales bacterium]
MTNPSPSVSLHTLEAALAPLLNGYTSSDGIAFAQKPLGDLSEHQAHQLIDALYSPDERFAEGFYKYRVDVLKNPEALAWHNTLEELEHYKHQLKTSWHDAGLITVGICHHDDEYEPVGLIGFRPLADHPRGQELLHVIEALPDPLRYAGNKGMVHSFSLLKQYRGLEALKYVFVTIGLRALQAHMAHVFFFFSDYRLKTVYQRYGLDFPEELKFPSSAHVIGCYSLTETNQQAIVQALSLLADASSVPAP